MEAKKTSKSDLENKRVLFLEIGFIVALAVVFLAFETKFYNEDVTTIFIPVENYVDEDILPIATTQVATPRPLPRLVQPLDILIIVDELFELDETDLIIEDVTDPNSKTAGVGNSDGEGEDPYGDEIGETDEPFVTAEDMPYFKGNLNKWLKDNLRYPQVALENGVGGRVYVEFIVERDGSISEAKVVGSADNSLQREALRVVNAMPNWEPGKQRLKPVRVKFTMPINFVLQR